MLPRINHIPPPTPEQLRHAAVALIAHGIDPDTPISDTDRAWGRDVAEALGLTPTLSQRYRDPVSRVWKVRHVTTQPDVLPTPWECEGQTSIDDLLPATDDDTEEDEECPDS